MGKLSHIQEGFVGFGATLKVLYEAHGSGDGLNFWLVDEASPNELGRMVSYHLPPTKGGDFSPKGWDFS